MGRRATCPHGASRGLVSEPRERSSELRGLASLQGLAPAEVVSPRALVGGGSVRWYVACAGVGREQALAARLRSSLPRDVLEDAFCPRWEALMKCRGEWLAVEKAMFPGYVVLASADGAALSRALRRLPSSVRAAGGDPRRPASVEAGAQAWLEGALDARRVLRASEGSICGGELTVERGPLRGSEARVRRVDRHKALAWVALGEPAAGGQTLLRAALAVPRKD